MDTVVAEAAALADKGDTVLLAPAAASMDIFGVLVLAMLVQQALNVGAERVCSVVAAERRVPDSRRLLAAVHLRVVAQKQTPR